MNDILSTKNLSKSYYGVRVLDSVDFSLRPGEVHALVGENGAGKSTLIKAIAGVIQADPGSEIYFDGERIPHMNAVRARQLGISVIFQDISLFPNLSVAENICSGIRLRGIHRRRQVRSIAERVLAGMDLELDPDCLLGEISVGQQQLVAIARAITFRAKIIVMDEPTSSLSSSETRMLFRLIRAQKEQGVSILYISHKFAEIFAIADRISVLRDGKLVAAGNKFEFDQNSLIRQMVGRELRFLPCRNQEGFGNVLFAAKQLTCEPYFRKVSFDVRRGEILGITGLIGAGRSEMAQAIFGLLRLQAGELILDGKTLRIRSAGDAIRKGIGYLPENRREQGLFMPQSMRVNTTVVSLNRILYRLGFLSLRKEQDTAVEYLRKLQIRPARAELPIENFSGGNQQKVLVSRWLNAQPRLLIVDEVTSGVDVGVKSEIHKLLRELASDGVAVVLISSDLAEVLAVSDRIVIMRHGTVVDIVETDSATQENVLSKSILTGEVPG